MNSATVAALLHCFLLAHFIQSAPVVVLLNETAQPAMTLVNKILIDVRTVHAAAVTNEGLTLDSSTQTSKLLTMVASLRIPAAPVLKLPHEDTLDVCLSRMLAGVQLYQGLLGDLSGRLSGLSDLKADLRDLLNHITEIKKAAQLGGEAVQNQSVDLASRLQGDYEVQVAANATLKQLLSFCHDLMRSLKKIDDYRRPAGTR
ncbi:colony stimulating factor 3 (granulocyte) b isoform X2 [Sebastes fasciatus]|uniref:Granulocyte colony stimulating factor 2 n=2 Tax=Sebastes TaxID=34820 RepID=C0STS3_SEBSC|nr:granulocyte colony stimulating factor 2 [Sebastes schlegelii]BAH90796.1 granulocyte colony-stimulating factor 1 [Sebastes schlegelii]